MDGKVEEALIFSSTPCVSFEIFQWMSQRLGIPEEPRQMES